MNDPGSNSAVTSALKRWWSCDHDVFDDIRDFTMQLLFQVCVCAIMSTSSAKGPCIGARQIKMHKRLATLFIMIMIIIAMVMVMVCSSPCIGTRQIKMAGYLVDYDDDDDDYVQWTLHMSPPNKDARTANKHKGENHLQGTVPSSNPGDEDNNVFQGCTRCASLAAWL